MHELGKISRKVLRESYEKKGNIHIYTKIQSTIKRKEEEQRERKRLENTMNI
jgi:hypothetical protein